MCQVEVGQVDIRPGSVAIEEPHTVACRVNRSTEHAPKVEFYLSGKKELRGCNDSDMLIKWLH